MAWVGKVGVEDVAAIRDLLAEGVSQKDIAAAAGLSPGLVGRINMGRNPYPFPPGYRPMVAPRQLRKFRSEYPEDKGRVRSHLSERREALVALHGLWMSCPNRGNVPGFEVNLSTGRFHPLAFLSRAISRGELRALLPELDLSEFHHYGAQRRKDTFEPPDNREARAASRHHPLDMPGQDFAGPISRIVNAEYRRSQNFWRKSMWVVETMWTDSLFTRRKRHQLERIDT